MFSGPSVVRSSPEESINIDAAIAQSVQERERLHMMEDDRHDEFCIHADMYNAIHADNAIHVDDDDNDEHTHTDAHAKRQCTEHEEVAVSNAQDFLSRFKQPAPSENNKKRKVPSLPPKGIRSSKVKNGSRQTDVKKETLRARPHQFPGEGLEVRSNQLFCTKCFTNVGSLLGPPPPKPQQPSAPAGTRTTISMIEFQITQQICAHWQPRSTHCVAGVGDLLAPVTRTLMAE